MQLPSTHPFLSVSWKKNIGLSKDLKLKSKCNFLFFIIFENNVNILRNHWHDYKWLSSPFLNHTGTNGLPYSCVEQFRLQFWVNKHRKSLTSLKRPSFSNWSLSSMKAATFQRPCPKGVFNRNDRINHKTRKFNSLIPTFKTFKVKPLETLLVSQTC